MTRKWFNDFGEEESEEVEGGIMFRCKIIFNAKVLNDNFEESKAVVNKFLSTMENLNVVGTVQIVEQIYDNNLKMWLSSLGARNDLIHFKKKEA